MHRPIATAALIGFAAILALASLTAHARLVKWTLDDVNFLIYPLSDNAGAILPHPVPDTIYPYLQPATGWFTVDTESHQIQIGESPPVTVVILSLTCAATTSATYPVLLG